MATKTATRKVVKAAAKAAPTKVVKKTAPAKKATPKKAPAKAAEKAPAKAAEKAPAKKTAAPRVRRSVENEGTKASATVVDEVKAETPAAEAPAKPRRGRPKKVTPPMAKEDVQQLVNDADSAIAEAQEARGLKRAKKAPAQREPAVSVDADGMPRSYVIKDVEQAIGWIKQGLTYNEMADLHEQLYPEARRVAPATFSLLRSRAGLSARHVRGHDNVPWPLSVGHKHSRVATLLRSWERLQRGMEVSPARQRMVYAWLAKHELAQFTTDGFMLPLKENPGTYVVDYDHTAGFTYPKRRKSDSPELIVRKPTQARIEELRAALA